jgi:CRISPR-associated protein Cmr5
LGQALATELAAAGPQAEKDDQRAHHELCVSLQRWLCRKDGGVYPSMPDLLQALMSHDESLYLRAQAEALAWLDWHKKFCRATFPQGEEE